MFSVGSYLKVWEVKKVTDKFVEAQCTTSKKIEDGKYETDFSGFVRFVGKAFDIAKGCQKGDSFKILKCGVSNSYDKEKHITYTNYVVFEVEQGNNSMGSKPSTSAASFVNIPDDVADEELPFN